jgi:hypothetical protein
MSTASSYSVTSPKPTCAVTGDPIEPGAPCVSLLYESDDGESLDRLDVALPVWQRGDRPAHKGKPIAHWRTTMRESDAPKRALIGDDEVLDLFDQLEDADGNEQLAFRYLLCLILIRKKLLVWEGARPATADEAGVVIVRRRRDKEGPMTEVIDPGLDNESIEAATLQLSAVMNLDADT